MVYLRSYMFIQTCRHVWHGVIYTMRVCLRRIT